MKKLKIIAIVLLVVTSIVGCENSTAKKAIEQGKLSMASKEYDKALASFKLAIDEGSKDEKIKIQCSIIESYDKAKSSFEEGDIEEAKSIIDTTDKEYVEYSIKYDIDSLKSEIDKKIKIQDEIKSSIEKIKELVTSKSYNEAKKIIDELKEKELSEENKKEIEELNNNIDSEQAKIEADKKIKEREQIKKDEVKSQQGSNSNNTQMDVCENCDKVSTEHNFIMGMTVCNTCHTALAKEILNFE